MQKEKEVKQTTVCFSLLFTDIIYCNVSLKAEMRKQQMISSWFLSGSINHEFSPHAQLWSLPNTTTTLTPQRLGLWLGAGFPQGVPCSQPQEILCLKHARSYFGNQLDRHHQA